nr:non-ribosomal peptide synthetase [Streptomyces sp. QL37]PPQ60233.1 hypothetical protein C5F59_28815 [Streptomyces sp. QL37]
MIELSYAQRRLWFLDQLEGPSATYNVAVSLRLTGGVRVDALRAALADVVGRHESLRTLIDEHEGEPVQRILEDVAPELILDRVGREGLADALAQAAGYCFDLAGEIPIRAWLFELSADEHVLAVVLHHIAADGWSMAPLLRDLSVAYGARVDGGAPQFEELPGQYADYALWQREVLGSEDDPGSLVNEQLDYWRSALEGSPAELALPYDRPHPAVPSHVGRTVPFEVDADVHRGLLKLAREHDVTLFMVLNAALAVVLSRMGAGEDVPVGAPMAGRGDEALDDLVGFFVNTVVLRTDLSGDPSFVELLERVREVHLGAHAHEDVPFDRLVDALNLDRSASRQALFQVMLVLQNNSHGQLALPGVEVSYEPVELSVAKFDLTVHVTEDVDAHGEPVGLSGGMEYAVDVFDHDTADQLAQRLHQVLGNVLAAPGTPLSQLAVLLPGEGEVLESWQGAVTDAVGGTIPELFAVQVAATPDAVAVEFGDTVLTYAELDARANQVAHWLIEHGVRAESAVAVWMDRSAELVVALLGVAKAGGVYVPFHPEWPQDRRDLICERADAVLVVTEEDVAGTGHYPVTGPGISPLPEQLAYVMFTSGSTGEPKGVAVRQRDVAEFVRDEAFAGEAFERVLINSPHSFDLSTFEFWVPLLNGGRVVVAPPGRVDGQELAEVIASRGVTGLWLTSGLFAVMAEEHPECFAGVAQVWAGGDVVSPAAVRRVQAVCPGLVVVNGYGPTEATTFITHHRMDELAEDAADVPIGRPLDNMRVYVLDTGLGLVPPGVVGELYVAGSGVARGYVGRPGLTAERFVASPFRAGERLYRTGDLVRWDAEGRLVYAGRADEQVKIRGFRIELGEVESALAAHPDIAQVVAVAREAGAGRGKQLVGYVVPVAGAESIDPAVLREFVAERLPEYMVPAALVVLDALPLTANGKVNRRALPEPQFSGGEHRAPRTPLEKVLCGVFAEVLGVGSVGVDDSFFDLGGDSIVAIQLVSRARAAGVGFSPRDVFRWRAVEALAGVAQTASVGVVAEAVGESLGEVPSTPVMSLFAERGGPVDGFYQSMGARVPSGTQFPQVERSVQAVLDHHDALRMCAVLEGDRWELTVPAAGALRAGSILRRVDVAGLSRDAVAGVVVEERVAAQGRLVPADGVLVQAVWFDAGPAAEGLLLLVVHHLVVDGVSWRILVPDVEAALAAVVAGREVELAAVATSFRRWARQLAGEAEVRAGELALWQRVARTADPLLGARGLDPLVDVASSAGQLEVRLPVEVAGPLLGAVASAFRGEVNDVLLTGLSRAVNRWRGTDGPVLVDLEGHGREEVAAGLDVTRTVGWFTTVYPVSLEPGLGDVGSSVKRVKEQLREIPDKGIGYGLLRYCNEQTAPELAGSSPQIGFNYLGRFQTGAHSEGALTQAAGLSFGTDAGMPLAHVVEVNALAEDSGEGPELRAVWSWAGELLSEERVAELAQAWFEELTALVQAVTEGAAGGRTPSDFPLVKLEQAEIEALESELAVAGIGLGDIHSLSPLQEGLAFHAGYDQDQADVYVAQWVLALTGVVDAGRLRDAMGALLDRHANLRSGFRQSVVGAAYQVVPAGVEVPFRVVDVSGAADAEAAVRELAEEERACPFSLDEPPLLRLVLAKLGESRYRLVFTNHHILLDGWSMPVLFGELFTLYRQGSGGLAAVRPYRDYLSWLAGADRGAAEAAWREALEGIGEPTLVAPAYRQAASRVPARLYAGLGEAASAALSGLAREWGVTVNTLVQAAWGVLIAGVTGRSDVVFGAVVSGRPAELPGVESMVGLFINTLPVRVRLERGDSLAGLVRRLQDEQAGLLPHHHLGLTEIQQLISTGQLFDTLTVYENFPLDDMGSTGAGTSSDPHERDLQTSIVGGLDAAHYPLALAAAMPTGDNLQLRLDYQEAAFTEVEAQKLFDRFRYLLQAFAAEPEAAVDGLDLLLPVERELLARWNDTGAEVPSGTLPELFAAQAARTPEAVAVVCGDSAVTYAELDAWSNRLARHLVGRGVGPGRFVASPFGDGRRMYRTGDLARWSASGELVYAGRADDQVKVRGIRIELGEVESALQAHPAVGKAVVIAREGQGAAGTQLVGYVVPAEGHAEEVGGRDLRGFVAERLPDYMVPAVVMLLDALPLMPNGKLDRASLPEPEFTGGIYRAPSTEQETVLCGLFAEILGRDTIGVDDSFFDLGGHSLLATRLTSRIRTALGVELGVRTVFEAPTVAGLAERLRGGGGARPALVATERPERLPLSYAQRRLWFLNEFEGPSAAYNIPIALRLTGEVDVDALRAALTDVVGRHESLRTLIAVDGAGVPYQQVLPKDEVCLELPSLTVAADDATDAVATVAAHEFDLSTQIPVRAALLELAAGEREEPKGPAQQILVVVVHHIAGDGESLAPLARDLVDAYTARRDGRAPQWADLPVQYADYALWQQRLLGDENDPESRLSAQFSYWQGELTGVPQSLRLPADRPRPAVASRRGDRVEFTIEPALLTGVENLARRRGATVSMVLQSALAVLLGRLGGGDDITIGSPIAGRMDEALADLVGFFANTWVLRADLSGDPTFEEVVDRVRDKALTAYDHQDVPFERLVELLNPERSTAHHPLFQVMFTWQNGTRPDFDLPGLHVGFEPVSAESAKFDLTFGLIEVDGPDGRCVYGSVEYATDLFDRATVGTVAERLVRVLRHVAAEPGVPVADVRLLDDTELRELTAPARQTVPVRDTVVSRFERQAGATPDAVAVTYEGVSLTYRELNERANRLARLLIERGAGPERFVALRMPRSEELVVAVLGVLKSGAAYVPIDPAYPAERIAYVLEDARPVLTVTPDVLAESAAHGTGDPGVEPAAAHPAYVIYTSGSTGKPKGVVVPHGNVVRLMDATDGWFASGPDDVWTLFHSYAFDFSVWELWGALLYGGRVVVVPYGTSRSPEDFLALLADEAVTMLSQTPSAFYQLMAADRERPELGDRLRLRTVVFGGEALDLGRLADWYARHPEDAPSLVNMYGTTETTVHITHVELDAAVAASASGSVVGVPIPDLAVYVLDERLRPTPAGVPGDLYVAGAGLARGYLNRPALTGERFVADPYGGPGERMYRTGDTGRRLPDGRLEHLGRSDEQVQLRGFRIEPGEIEAALLACPQVSQAAVVVREGRGSGGQQLVGYVVPTAAGADLDAVRAFVAGRLPDYMVPSALVVLDAIPLTPNGKLDRKALPEPQFTARTHRAPRDAREQALCAVFAEVLGLDRVGIDDDFFTIGGDSIRSIQIVARSRALGVEVSPREVFEHRTVAGLAEIAATREGTGGPVVLAELEGGGVGWSPLTPVERYLLELGGGYGRYQQSIVVELPDGIDADSLAATVAAVLDTHDVLRATLVLGDGGGLVMGAPGSVRAHDLIHRVPCDGRWGEEPWARLLEQEADAAAGRFDPVAGVLAQFVWFDPSDASGFSDAVGGGRLLIALHHLVVDGVSWRILLPDFAAAWEQVRAGEDPVLPGVVTSMRRWSHALAEEAVKPSRTAELPLWKAVLDGPDPLIGSRPVDPAADVMSTVDTVRVQLTAEVTEAVLTAVPSAFHGGVNDGLLAALALALAKWREGRGVSESSALIRLEGHGREEEVVPGADLSRTVGWFTSMFPVRLDVAGFEVDEALAGGPAAGGVLKAVKEQLLAIPDKGIGYGLLRHLNPDTAPQLAETGMGQIGFNYLGRFSATDMPENLRGLGWTQAPGAGALAAPDADMPVMAAVDVNAAVTDFSDGARLDAAFTSTAAMTGMSASGAASAPAPGAWVQPRPRRFSGMSVAEKRPR